MLIRERESELLLYSREESEEALLKELIRVGVPWVGYLERGGVWSSLRARRWSIVMYLEMLLT